MSKYPTGYNEICQQYFYKDLEKLQAYLQPNINILNA